MPFPAGLTFLRRGIPHIVLDPSGDTVYVLAVAGSDPSLSWCF